ncbi:MAG: winged helix-turn-helix domain-containing protein [Steroidobacteraceae bacterium]
MGGTSGRFLYEFGDFRVDPQQRLLTARADGSVIALPPRVFDTLLCLIEHSNRLIEKSALMQMIWPTTVVEENSLNRNISILRRALRERPGDHAFIATAPGRGYRFVADLSRVELPPSPSHAGGAAGAPDEARANSIAILCFANLTGDPANEYICEGMAEELIHALTGLPGLYVAARTSSFAYKSRPLDARLIARELGVGGILEGSLRREADRIRIAVQLIDGETGYHVWSKSVDHRLADLLALQEELARAVARALWPDAATVQAPASLPTRDVTTYSRLLEAESLVHTIPTRASVERALELARAATEREPECARAHALLAAGHAIAVGMAYDIPDALAQSERHAHRALLLDPREWDPHVVLGEANAIRLRWEDARAHYVAAVERGANEPMAFARRSMGLWQSVGYLSRAREDALQAHRLAPARPETAVFVALAAVLSGRDEECRWYTDLAAELGFPPTFGHMPLIEATLARREGRLSAESDAPAPAPAASAALPAPAWLQRWRLVDIARSGALDAAYDYAESLLTQALTQSGGPDWGPLWLPEMRAFRADPRFTRLVERLSMVDFWQRHGPPDGHDLHARTLMCR